MVRKAHISHLEAPREAVLLVFAILLSSSANATKLLFTTKGSTQVGSLIGTSIGGSTTIQKQDEDDERAAQGIVEAAVLMGADNQAEKVIDRIERMERMQAEIERLESRQQALARSSHRAGIAIEGMSCASRSSGLNIRIRQRCGEGSPASE